MIDNTAANMQNPSGAMGFLAASLGPGGPAGAIEEQEAAGQRQLVNSDRLPTDRRNPTEEFEALGFTFDDPDPRDPMFGAATLPEGWRREASDHPMWSYIVDAHGRRRASIFYKAAYYDRSAHMSLTTAHAYVDDHVYRGTKLILDDTWATRDAVLAAARAGADRAEERIRTWSGTDHADLLRAAREEREAYAAVVKRLTQDTDNAQDSPH